MSTTTATAHRADAGLRERKKQRTWAAIHEAAVELVIAQGLGVTVEEICARAGVSSRTFFNYFPSKGHAALGLAEPTVPSAARDAFVASGGALVVDLCDLVAETVVLPAERTRVKHLLGARPEVVPSLLGWMADTRLAVLAVAAERGGSDDAHAAVTLVMAALVESAHRGSTGSRADLAHEMRSVVAEMGRIARG